jgi:hypothetical protein
VGVGLAVAVACLGASGCGGQTKGPGPGSSSSSGGGASSGGASGSGGGGSSSGNGGGGSSGGGSSGASSSSSGAGFGCGDFTTTPSTVNPALCQPQLASATSCDGQVCSFTAEIPCVGDGGTPLADVDAGTDQCTAWCNAVAPQGAPSPGFGFCQIETIDGGTALVAMCGGCGI